MSDIVSILTVNLYEWMDGLVEAGFYGGGPCLIGDWGFGIGEGGKDVNEKDKVEEAATKQTDSNEKERREEEEERKERREEEEERKERREEEEEMKERRKKEEEMKKKRRTTDEEREG
jgi:hypothetical protein